MAKKFKGLVDLLATKQYGFTEDDILNECLRLNGGGKVNVKRIVKMLWEMKYIMVRYESLRYLLSYLSQRAKQGSDSHWIVTRTFRPKSKKKVKNG